MLDRDLDTSLSKRQDLQQAAFRSLRHLWILRDVGSWYEPSTFRFSEQRYIGIPLRQIIVRLEELFLSKRNQSTAEELKIIRYPSLLLRTIGIETDLFLLHRLFAIRAIGRDLPQELNDLIIGFLDVDEWWENSDLE